MLRTRADEMGHLARAVASRWNGSNARYQVCLTINRSDVLPRCHRVADALSKPFALRAEIHAVNFRARPPLELCCGDDDFGIREQLLVGVRVHPTIDVVAMKMRDQNGLDFLWIETCCCHALHEKAGLRA